MLTSFQNDLKPFAELAQSFTARELAGKVAGYDRYPCGNSFHPVVEKAYQTGFLGIMLPPALGGSGGGIGELCVVLYHICQSDASLGGIIFTHTLAQELLITAKSDKIAAALFLKVSTAKDALVAFPAYSDPLHIRDLPEASPVGEGYCLSGKIDMLVLGDLAAQAIMPARTRNGSSYSLFLVHLADPGLTKSDPVWTLGLHACPAVDVSMAGVKAHLIGEEGKGGLYFGLISGTMHTATGAMNAGIMKGSFNEALAYARERSQGGRRIVEWSEVGMILAGMHVKTETAVMCVEAACLSPDQGDDENRRRCIAAALHVHELACAVVTDGVQILGGYGYMKDYGQEKRYRDARQVQAFLGAAHLKKLSLLQESR